LIALFCFFYLKVYFQWIGFENKLVKYAFACVKISTISMIGNHHLISFSFNLPAENPTTVQATT